MQLSACVAVFGAWISQENVNCKYQLYINVKEDRYSTKPSDPKHGLIATTHVITGRAEKGNLQSGLKKSPHVRVETKKEGIFNSFKKNRIFMSANGQIDSLMVIKYGLMVDPDEHFYFQQDSCMLRIIQGCPRIIECTFSD